MTLDAASQVVRNDPGPSSGTVLKLAAPIPRRVLYLTPVENDVWQAIAGKTQVVQKEQRFGVPSDLSQLYREWATAGLVCDPDEYAAAFTKFVEAGFFSPVGGSHSAGRCTYRPNFRAGDYRIIPIETRPDASLDASWLTIIRDLESGKFQVPAERLIPAFKAWITANYPDVTAETARTKLMYHNRNYPTLYMGIIVRDAETRAWLIVAQGFEAYNFSALEETPKPPHEATLEQEISALRKQVRGLQQELKAEKVKTKAEQARADGLQSEWDQYFVKVKKMLSSGQSRKQ